MVLGGRSCAAVAYYSVVLMPGRTRELVFRGPDGSEKLDPATTAWLDRRHGSAMGTLWGCDCSLVSTRVWGANGCSNEHPRKRIRAAARHREVCAGRRLLSRLGVLHRHGELRVDVAHANHVGRDVSARCRRDLRSPGGCRVHRAGGALLLLVAQLQAAPRRPRGRLPVGIHRRTPGGSELRGRLGVCGTSQRAHGMRRDRAGWFDHPTRLPAARSSRRRASLHPGRLRMFDAIRLS